MTVLPTPFPCDSFEKAQAAMEAFNGLFDRVSRDDKYLQTTLRPAAEHDDFTVSYKACILQNSITAHCPAHASDSYPVHSIAQPETKSLEVLSVKSTAACLHDPHACT